MWQLVSFLTPHRVRDDGEGDTYIKVQRLTQLVFEEGDDRHNNIVEEGEGEGRPICSYQ